MFRMFGKTGYTLLKASSSPLDEEQGVRLPTIAQRLERLSEDEIKNQINSLLPKLQRLYSASQVHSKEPRISIVPTLAKMASIQVPAIICMLGLFLLYNARKNPAACQALFDQTAKTFERGDWGGGKACSKTTEMPKEWDERRCGKPKTYSQLDESIALCDGRDGIAFDQDLGRGEAIGYDVWMYLLTVMTLIVLFCGIACGAEAYTLGRGHAKRNAQKNANDALIGDIPVRLEKLIKSLSKKAVIAVTEEQGVDDAVGVGSLSTQQTSNKTLVNDITGLISGIRHLGSQKLADTELKLKLKPVIDGLNKYMPENDSELVSEDSDHFARP